MLWRIVGRELLEYVTSFQFAAVLSLTLLLMTTSSLVFSGWYESAMRDYPRRVDNLADGEGNTNLMQIPCSNGNRVFRAPSALVFCAGMAERELPNSALFAIHGLDWVVRRGEVEGALGGGIRLDWAFVVSVLLSFAAGVLTYRSIAGELQDGTLALVLSHPVSRSTILLGKYLAALLALAAALAVSAVFSLIVVQAMAPVEFGADEWLKIGFVGLASLLYLSCFVLVGLFWSVLSRNPTIAAVAFLFNWAFLVFVVPNLGGVLAEQFRDVEKQRQMRVALDTVEEQIPFTPGMSDEEIRKIQLQRELAEEKLLVQYIQELVRQVQLGQSLTRMSPAATYTYAVEGVTGGGTPRLLRFVDNVVRFREGVFQAILEADREDPQSEHQYVPWNCGSSATNFSRRTVDLGPAKEFRDLPLSSWEGLHAASLDLVLLVLYNGILFLVTYLRFVRQDVTPGSAL